MKQYKSVIIVICCCLFVLLVSGTYLASYAQFVKYSSKTVLFNGTVYGNYDDIIISKVYSNGTEVAGMNAVPAGYSLDQEMTGCKYGSAFYTNANNETVIKKLTHGDRCDLYYVPHLVYWNNSSNTMLSPGSYPATTYETAAAAATYGFCIASNSSKHYLCDTSYGVPVCVSQPYTKYGLTGHTAGSNFTTAQQTSAKAALTELFAKHGITVTCASATNYVSCGGIRLATDGLFDRQGAYLWCELYANGKANCG